MFRSRAEKKVLEAGYDPARLPPGQYLTEKWPVLHAGGVPDVDLATWDFAVWGEVVSPIRLSWQEFNRLPKTQVTQDIHCVTRWSRFDATFEGVPWSEIKKLVASALERGTSSRTPSRDSPRTCPSPRSRTRRRSSQHTRTVLR